MDQQNSKQSNYQEFMQDIKNFLLTPMREYISEILEENEKLMMSQSTYSFMDFQSMPDQKQTESDRLNKKIESINKVIEQADKLLEKWESDEPLEKWENEEHKNFCRQIAVELIQEIKGSLANTKSDINSLNLLVYLLNMSRN